LSLRFSARALREDGSVRAGAAGFVFSANGGAALDEGGLFTAPAPGIYRVAAALDGKTGESGEVVVHPENYLQAPVRVAGSGKVYKGYLGGSGKVPAPEAFTLSFPETAEFEVDGFLYLEGSTAENQTLSINVRKIIEEDPSTEAGAVEPGNGDVIYSRYVEGRFAFRLWLPQGKGKYLLELGEETLRFTNVRDEGEAEGENLGIWLYPTYNVPWDDYRIKNLVSDLLYGIEGDEEKIRAIHDYLVKNFHYDMVGFRNPKKRTSQDALTVLKHRSGVCEGYSRITAAMLRAAGIPTKIVSGRATGGLGSGGHAWNHVLVKGTWKFLDTTWDDPVPDGGPDYVRYNYYLLDSLTGIRNDHRGSVQYGE
jgi:transglutaminase-like putative cysteine protease